MPTLVITYFEIAYRLFRLVSKLVTLNDLEQLNDRRRALSRR